jgi:hypothetical protein
LVPAHRRSAIAELGRHATIGLAPSNRPETRLAHKGSRRSSVEDDEMNREDQPSSLWASVVAVLSVTGTIAVLYLPLALN